MADRSVVVKYSANIGSLLRDLDQAGRANARLAGESEKAGKKIDGMAAAGLGLAVAAGVAVAKFAEFDATMSQVAAATGETGAGLQSLRDAAVKAGADTQYSATEAAQGITELAKAGVSAKDIIGGGLAGALNLAAAGQLEVADAAEIAATAMTQFKLGGDQVSHVADLLAAGANKAQGGVGDLGMALKQAGLVAAQTGLSVEETTTALTAFASAGLLGSDAGTSLKTMLQRLNPQSDAAASLMDDLGLRAYDAQGNFVGLEKYAGQLKQGLSGLSAEQRNAALSTIFGSDAVRGASVLYNEGAEGVSRWSKEIDQSGYAAKQAAQLTDNLKGDIERLSGSFDTVLIQSGSGANDALRGLVQTTEKLVDIVGSIPGPVLLAGAAFGTMALVGPKLGQLAATFTGPLRSGAARFREEMVLQTALAGQVTGGYRRLGDEMVTTSGKISRASAAVAASRTAFGGLKGAASGALGVLGGPWGIALTAAVTGLTMFGQSQADARSKVQELTATLDEQTGKFTDASRKSIAESLMGDLSPEDQKLLQDMGISFTDLADAALAGGDAFEAQQRKLAALMEEKQRGLGIFSQEGRATEGLVRSYERAGAAAEATATQQQVLNQERAKAADGAGSAASAERGMAEATSQVNDTTTKAAAPVDTMAVLMSKLGAKSEDASNAIKGLQTAVDLLSGGELALRAATRDLASSIDQATEAAAAKADKTTSAAEVERNYQAALDRVAQSTQAVIKQQYDNNASVGRVNATYEQGRAALIKLIGTRGVHGAAAQREADKILGTRAEMGRLNAEYRKTPQQVATEIKAQKVAEAKNSVRQFIGVVNGVPTFKTVTFEVNIAQNVTKRITTVLDNFTNGLFSAGGNIVTAYAGGGFNTTGDVANGHVPAVYAPSGTVRAFAEPETGGEAYIPFANDWRRPRAKAIATQTVSILGGSVQWNAAGNVYGPGAAARGSSSTVATLSREDRALLRAVADRPQQVVVSRSAAGDITAVGSDHNKRTGRR